MLISQGVAHIVQAGPPSVAHVWEQGWEKTQLFPDDALDFWFQCKKYDFYE
jgi:hypothetical protein